MTMRGVMDFSPDPAFFSRSGVHVIITSDQVQKHGGLSVVEEEPSLK